MGPLSVPLLGRLIANLARFTEQFDNAAWAKAGTAVTPDQAVSPAGGTTADFIKEDGTTGGHNIQVPSFTSKAVPYTLSVHAKPDARTRLMLYGLNGDGKGRGFDLSAGTTFTVNTIADAIGYGIMPLGDGWFRCWINFVGTATTGVGAFYLVSGTAFSYAGDNASGLYLWGAQIEEGMLMSPYRGNGATAIPRYN